MEMKRLLLISVISLGFGWSTTAQRDLAFVNQQLEAFTQELAVKGVTNWISTTRFCDGRTEMFMMPDGSSCFSKGTYYAVYLFYPNGEGKMKMKKFDNCGSFFPFDYSEDKLLSGMLDNWEQLGSEEVKPYQTPVRNTKPEQRTAIFNCRRSIKLAKYDQRLTKRYHLFDLIGEGNLNYQHNNELYLIKMEGQMDELIEMAGSNLNRLKQE